MSTTPRTPYLGTYLVLFIITALGVIAAVAAIQAATGYNIGNGGTSIMPPMIAALITGQRWGKAAGVVPDNRAAWRFALVTAIATVALQILVAMAVLAAAGEAGMGMGPMIVGVLVFYTLIVIGVNRWFVTFGAKSALKSPK
jgi:hypothetical protein